MKRSHEDNDTGNDEALRRRRRRRSLAIAWVLGGLVALFFVMTLVRLGANVANRPL
jgi:hypothetical protein